MTKYFFNIELIENDVTAVETVLQFFLSQPVQKMIKENPSLIQYDCTERIRDLVSSGKLTKNPSIASTQLWMQ